MLVFDIFLYSVIFVFGAIVGSFLNVVIYRLHTGRSVNGRSHCLSCGALLRWFELFPLFSYVFLRGKCRHCRAFIPPRYFFVELITGLSFVWLWLMYADSPVFFGMYILLASLLIVVAVYDIRHTIIPDELSIGAGVIALVHLGYSVYQGADYGLIFASVFSGLGAGLFIGLLWYLSKGRWMGLGDAKLAIPLGIMVGYPETFSMIVLSFWIGAIIAGSLLLVQVLIRKGKTSLHYPLAPITMKSEVPFAPFLIFGFISVHFFHANVFDITFLLFVWGA